MVVPLSVSDLLLKFVIFGRSGVGILSLFLWMGGSTNIASVILKVAVADVYFIGATFSASLKNEITQIE